jgi:hypothetical protein
MTDAKLTTYTIQTLYHEGFAKSQIARVLGTTVYQVNKAIKEYI